MYARNLKRLPQGLAKSHPMLKLSEPRIGPNRIELRFALQPADQSGSILKRSRRTPGRYRQELCRCRRSISGNVYLCSFAQIINYFFRSGAVPSESLNRSDPSNTDPANEIRYRWVLPQRIEFWLDFHPRYVAGTLLKSSLEPGKSLILLA